MGDSNRLPTSASKRKSPRIANKVISHGNPQTSKGNNMAMAPDQARGGPLMNDTLGGDEGDHLLPSQREVIR